MYTGDGQETRRNNYNTSQPQYNHVNANVIVINCTTSPERSHNKQNKQHIQWHDRWPPHSVANGPTSVSMFISKSLGSLFLAGFWFEAEEKTGTVKVMQDKDELLKVQ